MSLPCALLVIAQSGAAVAVDAPVARTAPIAERVTARATVLRPARIRFTSEGQTVTATAVEPVQRRRDDAGTIWIEFS